MNTKVKNYFKKLVKVGFEVLNKMRMPYFEGVAAELGFFFLLSIVPIFIVFVEILGFFELSNQIIHDVVNRYASEEIADVFVSVFDYNPSGTFNFVFTIFALWAASKAQYSLIRISNYSYGFEDTRSVHFIRQRLSAIFNVISMIFLIIFSLIILIYGRNIIDLVFFYLESFLGISIYLPNFWYLLRWPLAIAVYFLVISYNFAISPTKRQNIKSVLPGSIFASIFLLLSSFIYAFYLANFASYNILYGSLAAVVALLLWFYMIGFILVLGIQINVIWPTIFKKVAED